MPTAARTPRRLRRAWAVPVLAVVAAGLIALAFLPDLPNGDGVRAVGAAASAPVVPANGFSSTGGTGAIVIPAPAVGAPPSLVVPRPEVVHGLVVPPYVPRGVSPDTSPPPARCGGYATPRRITPTVAPGAGQATVTFPSDPSKDVQGYRVQAVNQHLVTGDQPPHVVATAGQVTGCAVVTVALTGLTPGDPYVFWVEEQQVDASNGKTQFVQVGTSQPVVIG
jgi:hypothetical protein